MNVRLFPRVAVLALLLTACGSKTPTPASTGGPTSAVITWHREGGIAGFCDDLFIHAGGTVVAQSCGAQSAVEVGRGELPPERRSQLQGWLETFKSFDVSQTDAATTDAMTIRLAFAGTGSDGAGESVRKEMLALAAEVYAKVSTSATSTPEVSVPLPDGERAFAAAREAMAAKLGVDALSIQRSRVEAVDWPDGCLGLPKAHEACIEVIIPGYRVVLDAGGTFYEVRTDRDGSAVRINGKQ